MNYSVIIPHKNSPDLLARCIDSIPLRKDIEIIVVDDNSDENMKPQIKRSGLHIILTSEGRGAGYARNIALQKAKGQWLVFADADDFFLPDAFTAFDNHVNSQADIIFFASNSIFSDTGQPANRQMTVMPYLNAYKAEDKHSEYILRLNYFEPWGKMIRRKMVEQHNILFDEVRWANDVMFSTKIGVFAHSIEVDMKEVYCITIAKGSLIHQRSLESRRCRYEVMLRTNQYLREVGLKQYQHSIMYSLRRAAKFGPKALIDFIKLGRKYHANFFIGAGQWFSNAWKSFWHNEDKGREKYIVKS